MLKALLARLKQGYRTNSFPKSIPSLPEKFCGLPDITSFSMTQFDALNSVCPTDAFTTENSNLSMDIGKCIFCRKCEPFAKTEKLPFTKNHMLSSSERDSLKLTYENKYPVINPNKYQKLFRRSLKLRVVSAGGCNACELDLNVLNTLVWDIGRFGIQFVASPRHADGLIITGPVTNNMKFALQKAYNATSKPKVVIVVGACAISGGIYANNPETLGGADKLFNVDLYIPGCPPHPLTILDALVSFLGRK